MVLYSVRWKNCAPVLYSRRLSHISCNITVFFHPHIILYRLPYALTTYAFENLRSGCVFPIYNICWTIYTDRFQDKTEACWLELFSFWFSDFTAMFLLVCSRLFYGPNDIGYWDFLTYQMIQKKIFLWTDFWEEYYVNQ